MAASSSCADCRCMEFSSTNVVEIVNPAVEQQQQLLPDGAAAGPIKKRPAASLLINIPARPAAVDEPAQAVNSPATANFIPAQIEALWHYECVVSPRSPGNTASPTSTPRGNRSATNSVTSSPKSPAATYNNTPAHIINSTPLVSPSGALNKIGAVFSPRRQLPSWLNTNISPVNINNNNPSSSVAAVKPSGRARSRLAERVFNTFDQNGDGKVTREELSGIFQKLGLASESESDHELLQQQQHNSTGRDEAALSTAAASAANYIDFDWEEFVTLYRQTASTVSSSRQLVSDADVDGDASHDLQLAAFHVFDKDRNGFISPEELQTVLCSLGFGHHADTLEACVDMIARVDENGDGQIDFFEFKKMLGSGGGGGGEANTVTLLSASC